MRDIKKGFIDGEEIFLKEGLWGWNVVYPWKNEDGSINWFNLLTGGSWLNLAWIIILTLVIIGAIYEYVNNINILLDCFKDSYHLEICKQSFGYKGFDVATLIP